MNIIESSNNLTSKEKGRPKGKAKWIPTDGISERPPAWESKLNYWRKMINKMTGYEVLE